jgi:uncharacterized protein with HEPN domain
MKDDAFYLLHINDSIVKIEEHVSGVDYQEFLSRRLVQSAVIRELEIIGEAAKNVSAETKSKHPEIPWRLMSGMRDKLIHDYFGVDLDAVWETVERDLPALKEKLADL